MRKQLEAAKKEDLIVKLYQIEREVILSQIEVIKRTCNLKDNKICVEKGS